MESGSQKLAIKEALNETDKLKKITQISGSTYILTGYQESNTENKPGRRFGGILVFKIENKKPVLFWESEEYVNTGKVAGFRDINNDGIDEIVWDYDLGVTGRNNAIYIYKFDKDKFRLITPIEIEESSKFSTSIKYGRTILSGDNDLTYMKDIDGDKIQEIVVGYREGNIINRQTYKFNGQEYKLWKEEKIKG
ncbi:MAG: VCBS repeat-containing protein [Candidatus Liptonbacteria bacterium]|nr:VCBS repeat-containing protein [Candidatus Liptonbacteria bacterium]